MSMQSLVDGERDIDFSTLIIVKLRYFLQLEAAAYIFVRHSAAGRIALTV
jgi:[CysO sulfur-carrier protein]-S-L-cysteine hydrolase